MWKKAWDVSNDGVAELQAARYSIKTADIMPNLAGLVDIALDVAFCVPAGAVPAFVSSYTAILAAIAVKFPEVRQKLWERRLKAASKLSCWLIHRGSRRPTGYVTLWLPGAAVCQS